MRLSIVFGTPDKSLRTFVGLRKDSLIPEHFRIRGPLGQAKCSFTVSALIIEAHTNIEDITKQIFDRSLESDGLIFLIDEEFSHLAGGVLDATFVVPFPGIYAGKNIQNRVGMILTPALRHYSHLMRRFVDGKFRKIFLLPLEIFQAVQLQRLRNLVVSENMIPGFTENLDILLSDFRERQVPKKRVTYPDRYIRDDRPLFFQYGHEEHAIIETGASHTLTCALNSEFRFGCRYDSRRHFNVSEEDKNRRISESFLSCHGQCVAVTKRTHLNIFPNGFL